MSEFKKKINYKILRSEFKGILSRGLVGIEKESLRLREGKISNMAHPESMGSPLCNKYITNDFSEAQPELITPPFSSKIKVINFLEDLHHFFHRKIPDEIFWPFSIPPFIKEDEIPIATFGTSNMGVFKHIYRKGLSMRYGKKMQAISGIHFNYSIPDELWSSDIFKKSGKKSLHIRSDCYMGMLRNVTRMNWIILYFFGASSFLPRNFIEDDNLGFKKFDHKTSFLPNATSLRMSEYGYQNKTRSNISVSQNSLSEYISDLHFATTTRNEDFEKIYQESQDYNAQLSSNYLQIEDEYYSVARVKSNKESDERFISKLKKSGVSFLELRSIDLNPFSQVGIDYETIIFLECFLLFCFFKISPPIGDSEQKNVYENELRVAKYGRQKDLKLLTNNKEVTLRDWAREIIDEMSLIAEIMDDNEIGIYSKTLNSMYSKIDNPEQTLSAMVSEKIFSEGLDYLDIGKLIGQFNMDYFMNKNQKENENWEFLKEECAHSMHKQQELKRDSRSFDDYKEDFLR